MYCQKCTNVLQHIRFTNSIRRDTVDAHQMLQNALPLYSYDQMLHNVLPLYLYLEILFKIIFRKVISGERQGGGKKKMDLQ
jgi:hypothetical protein